MCVCVWQWKTYQSVEVSPFPARYINGRAVHTRDVVYIFQRRGKKKRLFSFYTIFPSPPSSFVLMYCGVHSILLLTIFYSTYFSFFHSSPLIWRPLISIHPILSRRVFVFVWRWLRVMKHWTWMIPTVLLSPLFSVNCLVLTNPSQGGWTVAVEFTCPVVLTLSFSSSSSLQRNT